MPQESNIKIVKDIMKPEEQMRKKVESPSRKSGILWGWVNVALSAMRFLIRAGRLFFFSKFSLIPVLILLAVIPLAAFEAHILNVTATIVQIDPPVLTPPGDIGWDNSAGRDATSRKSPSILKRIRT